MMLKRLPYILAVAVTFFLAAACEKADDETIPVLTISQNIWSAQGGTLAVSIAATSTWTLDVEYADGQQTGWIHFSPASGSGFGSSVMTVDANTGSSARQAVVRLSSPNYSATSSVSQSSGSAPGGPVWMEMPATDKTGCVLLIHDMSGGRYVSMEKSGVRNWSCYWDYDNHLSHWVAYPLNKGLIGSGKRTDAWGFDPLLDASMQPDVNVKYGGGWTRGHQIPSADRLSYSANVSTFYSTNMTPQDYDFNCGIWANLEGKVRDYSVTSDTLYVVTGCDIAGSTALSGWNTGFQVPVPSAYYKALLRKKGSTYSAIAFYFPHTAEIAGKNFMDYIISVDELESRTGVDFFVNLPVVLGADKAGEIESADPKTTVKDW